MQYHKDTLSVLHITNDFTGSQVYKKLISELDQLGIRQIIYTPIRDASKVGSNYINFNTNGSDIIYAPILNNYSDRLAYPLKILKIYKDISKKIDLKNIDLIHAHTWYSDGGVAYLLSKKHKIPFIVTVRNTDMNLFHKKLIYLRPYGKLILNQCKAIILPSKSYETRLKKDKSSRRLIEIIKDKLKVLPNGVDNFWIKNSIKLRTQPSLGNINILFVGRFDENKQIVNLIKSVILINESPNYNVTLHIVGSGGRDESKVLKLAYDYPEYIKLHGAIYNKDQLLSIYQMCDIFAMPSRHETFGLVYIEAMLQGLPILYTEGEGIDGIYGDNIGEKVSSHHKYTFKKQLLKIINNLDNYKIPVEELRQNHNWTTISQEILSIYLINKR